MTKPLRQLSERARRAAEQPISYLMHAAVANPELISLAAGLVDHASLPAEEVFASLRELFADADAARRTLQYGTTPGYERLREMLVQHLAQLEGCSARELGIGADRLVLTTGSQQLLELVSEVLLDPGDIVLVAAPDYFVYLGVLAALGARAIGIPMDEQGIVPDGLAETLSHLDRAGELNRVKLLYCVSFHQNPTGVTLAADRRPAILELVEKWSTGGRIFVLEDAAYRELGYSGTRPPSLRSFDRGGDCVILTQTFSKSFSPGLKVGYSVLPAELLGPVLHQKGNHDFGSANLNQHLLARLMESGRYAAHVERLRGIYREKLAATLDALGQEFGRHGIPARWTRPDGGMYVWVALSPEIDTRRGGGLFERCLECGVLYVPGEYCFPPESIDAVTPLGGPRHTMRLSFGVPSADRIREGVRRLAAAAAE